MAKKTMASRRTISTKPARSTRNTPSSKPSRRAADKPKAAAAKPAKVGKDVETPHIECIARGVLIAGSRVLLCRNLKHGYLYLPGGHVEFGESAAQALAREFLEEANLAVRVGSLALVSEGTFGTRKRMHHEINLVFHVEHDGARRRPPVVESQEADLGFDWLDFAAIPETDIRPEAAKAFLLTLGAEAAGVIEFISEIQP